MYGKRIAFLFFVTIIFSFICHAEPNLSELLSRLEKAEQSIASLQHKLNNQQESCSQFMAGNPWVGAGYINAANQPFNAIGDGVTDNTNAIQAALYNASSLGGGIVYVPPGNYLVAGNLVIPSSVTLKGAWNSPPFTWGTGSTALGTTLFATAGAGSAGGAPFIFMNGNNAAIEGITIYYPNQIQSNPVVAYPFTIQGNGNDISIQNLLLVNPYQAIDFSSYSCPRHYIEGVYGQPLLYGVVIDQCYDIGRIKRVHWWPFWSQDPNVEAFQTANTISFLFYRSDWEVVEDVFSWGHHVGLYFTESSNGATNGQFTDIDFDNVDVGVVLDYTQEYGVMISNLNLANAGAGASKIGILSGGGGSAYATIRGLSIWGSFVQAVSWSSGGFLMMADSLLQQTPSGQPAITLNAGRAMIRGTYFVDGLGVAVDIGPGTDRVMVVDNELVGNTILNAGPNALVANNHQ